MITADWRERQARMEAEKPGVRFLFIEMRRPEPGIVYFEAPEAQITVRYETENFAKMLKVFIDEEVAPRLAPSDHTTVDVLLVDPAWKEEQFARDDGA